MLFIWYCITLYFIQTLSTHLIIQHSRQTQKGIIGHFSAILFTLFTSMKESRNVLKCNSGNCSINQSLSKNLAIWKTLEMNHSKDPSFQGIILSTKGYFSILTSLGKFFYIILHIFFLAEKEKKKCRQPDVCITWTMSSPSWKCFCLDSLGRKVSGP